MPGGPQHSSLAPRNPIAQRPRLPKRDDRRRGGCSHVKKKTRGTPEPGDSNHVATEENFFGKLLCTRKRRTVVYWKSREMAMGFSPVESREPKLGSCRRASTASREGS